MLCKHNRGEITGDKYKTYLLDCLRNNPNSDKVEPYSEQEFNDDCMYLYELGTGGNAFTDKECWGTVQALLKKYGILEDRTSEGGYNLDYIIKQRVKKSND